MLLTSHVIGYFGLALLARREKAVKDSFLWFNASLFGSSVANCVINQFYSCDGLEIF